MEEEKKQQQESVVSINSHTVNDVSQLGAFGEIPDTDFKLHPLYHKDGGIYMHDKEGLIVDAVKSMIKKLASLAVSGKVSDMFSVATPVAIHTHLSHLNLAANDMTYGNMLTKAASMDDPVDRMKQVAMFGLAAHSINPSLV